MNGQPLLAFGFDGFASVGTQEIVFPLAPGVGFLPLGINQAVALQPVKDRIQHPVAPFNPPAGKFAHLLDDFVAVTFAARKDGQQERFRGRGNQIFRKHGSLIHCAARYVNGKVGAGWLVREFGDAQ